MSKKKYNRGLVIGRFQPFHLGHKYLIEKALEVSEKIIIGVGSSNKTDEINPYSADTRVEFLKKFIKEERIETRVLKILKLFDNPDDDVWFESIYKQTGSFDVTIGNNQWNNGIIQRYGIPAVYIGFYNRHKLEGVKIRKLMKKNKKWVDRVPNYLVSLIKNNM